MAKKITAVFTQSQDKGDGQFYIPDMQHTADKIRSIRRSNNLTQKEMAEKLGISIGAFRQYETNQRKIPIRVARAVSDLFESPAKDMGLRIVNSDPNMIAASETFSNIMNLLRAQVPDAYSVEGKISKICQRLTEDGKQKLLEYAELLASHPDYSLTQDSEDSDPGTMS